MILHYQEKDIILNDSSHILSPFLIVIAMSFVRKFVSKNTMKIASDNHLYAEKQNKGNKSILRCFVFRFWNQMQGSLEIDGGNE